MSYTLTDTNKTPSVLSNENYDERLILIFHPPAFILQIYDAIHVQIVNIISLFIPIEKYYFMAYELTPFEAHWYRLLRSKRQQYLVGNNRRFIQHETGVTVYGCCNGR